MPVKGLLILEKILDVASARQKILASNIANAETPGYRAKDINFAQELGRALDGKETKPVTFDAPTTMPSKDGNTVNIEIEMGKVAENTMTYETAVQLLGMKIRMIKDVVRGGR